MNNVTTASPATVRVTLVDADGRGETFFSDICRMIEQIASRANVGLVSVPSTGPVSNVSRTYACPGCQVLVPELLAEVGTHRGQLLPVGSTHGRVVTLRVEVEASGSVARSGSARTVKTYNYIVGRATRHSSGETRALGEVLAGLA